jgi:hypothetical protein
LNPAGWTLLLGRPDSIGQGIPDPLALGDLTGSANSLLGVQRPHATRGGL